jgi:hypothetical protein
MRYVRRVSSRSTKKRAGRGPTTIPTPASTSVDFKLTKHGEDDSKIDVNFDLSGLPSPEHTLSVDCGIARLRHDVPHLLFAQLNPLNDGEIIRLLVVRYAPEWFLLRSPENKRFLSTIEAHLETLARRQEPGRFSKMFQNAKPAQDCAYTVVDAEIEVSAFTSGRGSMSFYAATTHNLSNVLLGRSSKLDLLPLIRITMTLTALADLLQSWIELAGVATQ